MQMSRKSVTDSRQASDSMISESLSVWGGILARLNGSPVERLLRLAGTVRKSFTRAQLYTRRRTADPSLLLWAADDNALIMEIMTLKNEDEGKGYNAYCNESIKSYDYTCRDNSHRHC